jgi:FKBP-type peptidyl-prolyl cis-trans isomerase
VKLKAVKLAKLWYFFSMLPFKRKKTKHASNPTWLKWIVMIFIAYAIFINYTERQAKTELSRGSVLGVTKQADDGTAFTRADFGTYTLPKGVIIGGDIQGKGEEIRCGQTATLRYEEILPQGVQPLDETRAVAQEITLQVGVEQEGKLWVTALPGMKQGGIREVKMSARSQYAEEELQKMGLESYAPISYRIELLDFLPKADFNHIPFQATDRIEGTGNTISCGTFAHYHLKLWNPDGTLAYDSRKMQKDPLVMQVGNSDIMYGLDRGMLNMKQSGIRSIIIPPAYAALNPQENNPLKGIINENQVVLAEIELLEVKWKE